MYTHIHKSDTQRATISLLFHSGSDARPQVHTSLGKLQGVWMTSELGSRYAAYLGVPYAQPPLGKLRFEVRTIF